MDFKKVMAGLMLISAPVFAIPPYPTPGVLEATTPQNIPTTANAVSTIFVSASTVVTVTVPYFADTYINSGDPIWVCDSPTKRCGSTFPTATVSVTGWVFNPSGRRLLGNLQQSTSLIYVYARTQDLVSTTAQNLTSFEWSCQTCAQ